MTTTYPTHTLTVDPLHTGDPDTDTAHGDDLNPLSIYEYLSVAWDMFSDESIRPLASYIQGQAQILAAVALHDIDAQDGRFSKECVQRLRARVEHALAKMEAAAEILDEQY